MLLEMKIAIALLSCCHQLTCISLFFLSVNKLLNGFPAIQANSTHVFWERRRNSQCVAFLNSSYSENRKNNGIV